MSICLCMLISVQLLQYGSTTLLWDPDLLLVMEAVEKREQKDLSDETAQALRQFLRQVYSQWTLKNVKNDLILSLCKKVVI